MKDIDHEIEELLTRDSEFRYMLLDRMRSDCLGYLEYGRKLWAGDKESTIKIMRALWDSHEVKPEWLTRAELNNLAQRMGVNHAWA